MLPEIIHSGLPTPPEDIMTPPIESDEFDLWIAAMRELSGLYPAFTGIADEAEGGER